MLVAVEKIAEMSPSSEKKEDKNKSPLDMVKNLFKGVMKPLAKFASSLEAVGVGLAQLGITLGTLGKFGIILAAAGSQVASFFHIKSKIGTVGASAFASPVLSSAFIGDDLAKSIMSHAGGTDTIDKAQSGFATGGTGGVAGNLLKKFTDSKKEKFEEPAKSESQKSIADVPLLSEDTDMKEVLSMSLQGYQKSMAVFSGEMKGVLDSIVKKNPIQKSGRDARNTGNTWNYGLNTANIEPTSNR
jgi:hypothetical protein